LPVRHCLRDTLLLLFSSFRYFPDLNTILLTGLLAFE
jgi:hypothetical protein